MPQDNDALHEFGKNAHKQSVSAGRYVVSPDERRLVLLQPHIAMKPGWREATDEDIQRFHDAEQARRPAEQAAREADDDSARQESDAKGALERELAELHAERAAAKDAQKNVKPVVIAPETVLGESADGTEYVEVGGHVEADGKIVATTEEFFESGDPAVELTHAAEQFNGAAASAAAAAGELAGDDKGSGSPS